MELRRTAVIIVAGLGLAMAFAPRAYAQSPSPSPRAGHAGHDTYAGRPADKPVRMGGASMTARLVDPMEKAKKQAATVQVSVKGIRIVDPAQSGERPIRGQGHLHYQVDDGPVVATTAPKLSFHGLKPGSHTITVVLAANDHSPLGPEEKLTVSIP